MKLLPTYRNFFEGYYLDRDITSLPHDSGVYMIYRCVYDENTDKVSLKELFYIGKASDLYQEVRYHKRRNEFLAQVMTGEEVCYSYTLVSKLQYDIIENALVFMQKPRLNTNLVNSYDHQEAAFHFTGSYTLLKFTDYKIVDGVVIAI